MTELQSSSTANLCFSLSSVTYHLRGVIKRFPDRRLALWYFFFGFVVTIQTLVTALECTDVIVEWHLPWVVTRVGLVRMKFFGPCPVLRWAIWRIWEFLKILFSAADITDFVLFLLRKLSFVNCSAFSWIAVFDLSILLCLNLVVS
jgi:hypothetical protein